jgi:hypothetical protein
VRWRGVGIADRCRWELTPSLEKAPFFKIGAYSGRSRRQLRKAASQRGLRGGVVVMLQQSAQTLATEHVFGGRGSRRRGRW